MAKIDSIIIYAFYCSENRKANRNRRYINPIEYILEGNDEFK